MSGPGPSARPPAMARRLLRMALHPSDRGPALADLVEEFEERLAREGPLAARRWYWAQARQSFWPALERRLADRVPSGSSLATELRHAWRGLRRRRFGAIAHVGLVAVAVGASGLIFSAADSFALLPSPYPNAGRLVTFQRSSPVGVVDMLLPEERRLLDGRPDLFTRLYSHQRGPTLLVETRGVTESVRAWDVDPGLFEALGTWPIDGRPIAAADAAAGAEPVAVVREDLARRFFGRATAALGQVIEDGTTRLRVVGVMPTRFRFPTAEERIWRPLLASGRPQSGATVAAVAPGVPEATVAQSVTRTLDALSGTRPAAGPSPVGAVVTVPLTKAVRDPRAYTNYGAFDAFDAPRLFVLLLVGAVCLALIVLLNVAGLELAVTFERRHLHALQRALGATRGWLLRTALLETTLLTTLGAIIGSLAAAWGVPLFSATLPPALTAVLSNPIDIDERTLAFMAVMTIAAAALTSWPVVWQLAAPAPAELIGRGGPTQTATRATSRIRSLLVSGQIALSVLLLVPGALLLQSYASRLDNTGIDAERLVTVEVTRPRSLPQTDAELDRALLTSLRSDPAVESVSRASRLLPDPGRAAAPQASLWHDGAAAPAGTVMTASFSVDPAYLQTIGARLTAGRFLNHEDAPEVVVIDEVFAKRFWANGEAVGARFLLGTERSPGKDLREVVGIVSHLRLATAEGTELLAVHRLLPTGAAPLAYVVRHRATHTPDGVSAAVRAAAPGCAVRVRTMHERYADVYGDTRLAAGVSIGFALTAVLVAMVGLFAVTTTLVAGRTREIGVRMALGATSRDIRRLVLHRALAFVGSGIAVGIAAALFASRWIRTQLFGLEPTDPATYVGVAVVLAVTAIAATWSPARRATRVDPITTLRAE